MCSLMAVRAMVGGYNNLEGWIAPSMMHYVHILYYFIIYSILYENIQQFFSNSMAEIETRFLAGFLLLFSYNNSNTSAIISGKIFKLARILLKILFRL